MNISLASSFFFVCWMFDCSVKKDHFKTSLVGARTMGKRACCEKDSFLHGKLACIHQREFPQ